MLDINQFLAMEASVYKKGAYHAANATIDN